MTAIPNYPAISVQIEFVLGSNTWTTLPYVPKVNARRGRTYHDRVTVTTGVRTVHGCGGDLVAVPVSLGGTRWTIIAIDGDPVRTARPTEVRFTADRISGNAGCNGFGGDYRVANGALVGDRVISTRMACRGPGMDVEGRFFHIIAGPARMTLRARDTLELSVPDGTAVLRRSD